MRCNGVTLAGKPCRRPAQISGYCIAHLPVSDIKQTVTQAKQPKLNYMEEIPLTWEEVRTCKNKFERAKLLQRYYDWIRLKRNQDKLKLRRQINKEYRKRIKLKGSKKS